MSNVVWNSVDAYFEDRLVGEDEALATATAVQTVGAKGYDGFLIAVVR